MISTEKLVPGDLFEIGNDQVLPCDAVLMQGLCLIDEASLTGESVPIHKSQLPDNKEQFSETEKAHLLYSGTYCLISDAIETPGSKALGLVLQTGFNTSKGLLIRSIMFGKSE